MLCEWKEGRQAGRRAGGQRRQRRQAGRQAGRQAADRQTERKKENEDGETRFSPLPGSSLSNNLEQSPCYCKMGQRQIADLSV